jgi:uncharacterized protein DUF6636
MYKLLFLVATAVLAAPIAASADVTMFRSPTGNIGCVYADFSPGTPNLRCDIRSGLKNPKLPPKPSSCSSEVDFGQGLWIARTGPAHIVCAGDTALDPQARVVPYGTSFVRGGFRCDSAFNGMTCKNQSGHGFFLNADVWRLF